MTSDKCNVSESVRAADVDSAIVDDDEKALRRNQLYGS